MKIEDDANLRNNFVRKITSTIQTLHPQVILSEVLEYLNTTSNTTSQTILEKDQQSCSSITV